MENASAATVLVLAALYWGTVLAKMLRFRRKRGRSPVLVPTTLVEKILLTFWVLIIVVWFAQPIYLLFTETAPVPVRLIPAFDRPVLKIAGNALIWPAYLVSLWAWRRMGRAWRLGIDQVQTTRLVTDGPFAFCRHPIYALQAVALLGSWFVLPTPLLGCVVPIHWVCVWLKAGVEERHMAEMHGDAYGQYCRECGRFVPKLWARRARSAQSSTEREGSPRNARHS